MISLISLVSATDDGVIIGECDFKQVDDCPIIKGLGGCTQYTANGTVLCTGSSQLVFNITFAQDVADEFEIVMNYSGTSMNTGAAPYFMMHTNNDCISGDGWMVFGYSTVNTYMPERISDFTTEKFLNAEFHVVGAGYTMKRFRYNQSEEMTYFNETEDGKVEVGNITGFDLDGIVDCVSLKDPRDFSNWDVWVSYIKVIDGREDLAVEPPDTTPPEITLINLTSEGGLGYDIYTEGSSNNKQTGTIARTNDTTPTFFIKTNEVATLCIINNNRDLNWTDCFEGTDNADTEGLTHTITLNLTNQTGRFGLFNFSIGGKDALGNENSTSTSGKFLVNITDPVPPRVTIDSPDDGVFFVLGNNNTITFNFNATDLVDVNFSCNGFIDDSQVYTNATYLNATEGFFVSTVTGLGSHTANVTCTDSYNNINSSQISFDVITTSNITLLLDGLNESRKYEFETTVNLSIITDTTGQQSCIDIDDDVNVSCSIGNWSYYFNITELIVDSIINGSKRFNMSGGTNDDISLKIDNKTELVEFSINLIGHDIGGDFPSNITIDLDKIGGDEIVIPGKLRGNIAETDNFRIASVDLIEVIEEGTVSFIVGGTGTIRINVTNAGDIINFTMMLNGSDIDLENEFSYIEHFNGTDGAKIFNDSLSFKTDAPLGIFDDFVTNVSGRWNADDSTPCVPTLSYNSDGHGNYIEVSGSGSSCTMYLDYTATEADFRNSSRIEIDFAREGSCSRGLNVDCGSADFQYFFYATDGTSQVQLDGDYHGQCSGNPSDISEDEIINYTLIKKSGDYKNWQLFKNGTSLGNKDLSSLDFTKQIKFRHSPRRSLGVGGGCSSSAGVRQYEVKWSGVWLNRSTNNGTYQHSGNITQCVNVTKTNLSKATLDCTGYKPPGTEITYFLTNTGNATNPTFESVQLGIQHTFDTIGNELCWRGKLNSSVNTSSPVIRKCTISVTKGTLENISVDFGDDGNIDWNYFGVLNASTSPKFVNGSVDDFFTYREQNCKQFTTTCQYPIIIGSGTSGTVTVFEVNTTVRLNNVVFNISKIENYSIINMTVKFLNGILELGDIVLSFRGSLNFSIFVHSRENSTHLLGTDNHSIQVKYSPINVTYPFGINFFNIFVSATPDVSGMLNQSRINPWGQIILTNESRSHPIFNITTRAYDDRVYVAEYLNHSLDDCITIEAGPFMNMSNTSILNNITLQDVAINLSILNITGQRLYHSVNLTNCNVSKDIYFDPVFCFNSWCQDCVRTGLLDSDEKINPNGRCLI